MSPYAHRSDQFTSVCANALLTMVILISVLLKMNAGYIAETTADGLDPDTASNLLVASNVLVVVLSAAAYVISATPQDQQGNPNKGGRGSSQQEPLLDSRSEAQSQSTGGDEEDITEAGEWSVASSSSTSCKTIEDDHVLSTEFTRGSLSSISTSTSRGTSKPPAASRGCVGS
jgi:hypothetical protein